MKLGVFQCEGGGLDPDVRLDRLAAALAGADVDLVVCPELFMSGYNVGDDLHHLAESAQGAFFDKVGTLAERMNTAIVYGYPERAGDHVFNAAACVGCDRTLRANHRKRFNSPNSFEETYFETGDTATVFEFGGLRIAILICYEAELTEFVREAALEDADLVLVPTALVEQWDVVPTRVMPTRAFENGVWLAYANHAGAENGFTYFGGSRIVAPDGVEAVVAGAEEALICAEIDRKRVLAARTRIPYLRDARLLRARI